MQKSEMSKQERIRRARYVGWLYLKDYICVSFDKYCQFLDDLASGKPKPAVWMAC